MLRSLEKAEKVEQHQLEFCNKPGSLEVLRKQPFSYSDTMEVSNAEQGTLEVLCIQLYPYHNPFDTYVEEHLCKKERERFLIL